MKDIVRSADNLALIFLALPVSVFVKVALQTRKYCYEDWIVEKERRNEHGNVEKKSIWWMCALRLETSQLLDAGTAWIMRQYDGTSILDTS